MINRNFEVCCHYKCKIATNFDFENIFENAKINMNIC